MSSDESKGVDLDGREGLLELGGIEGEKPIIRMYYMRKNSFQ